MTHHDAFYPMFYGWNLCALSTLGNLIIQGTAIYSMNSFIEPLFEAYGWSRTTTSASMGIAALIGFGCAPLIGTLDMRIGSRKMMCIGSLLAAAALFGMGSTDNYYIFTACFCLVWAASQCCGGLVANGLLCHWFKVHRGLAFGIAAVGMSFAGSIIPIFSLFCITHWGIANAYYILGVCAALLCIPCFLMVRERPEMMGLTPDGLAVEKKAKCRRRATDGDIRRSAASQGPVHSAVPLHEGNLPHRPWGRPRTDVCLRLDVPVKAALYRTRIRPGDGNDLYVGCRHLVRSQQILLGVAGRHHSPDSSPAACDDLARDCIGAFRDAFRVFCDVPVLHLHGSVLWVVLDVATGCRGLLLRTDTLSRNVSIRQFLFTLKVLRLSDSRLFL